MLTVLVAFWFVGAGLLFVNDRSSLSFSLRLGFAFLNISTGIFIGLILADRFGVKARW